MPKFSEHESSDRVKLLLIGDSGAGKTYTLGALANAGYKLRILDFDAGLDTLGHSLTEEGAARTNYVTLKDKPKDVRAMRLARTIIYSKWKIGDEDLGAISDWGTDVVLAVDSGTFLGMAACHQAVAENGGDYSKANLTQPEWGSAIREASAVLDTLTGEDVHCNIVVTALPIGVEDEAGVSKEYPYLVTRNFSKLAPRFFNNVIAIKTRRDGSRYFRTIPDNRMVLKNTNPAEVPTEMDADLATLFKLLTKGEEKK